MSRIDSAQPGPPSVARDVGARSMWVALIATLLATATPAWSQVGPAPVATEDPCGAHVTAADRQRAMAHKRQAFAEHRQLHFQKAADLYRSALEAWNHPEIHLALARVLLLDARLLESHKHASAALLCPKALENDEERASARSLLRRLESQLARIEVHSPDAYTEIALNGADWAVRNNALVRDRVVYPGQYELTVWRPGHVTLRHPLRMAAGQRAVVRPRLVSNRDATTLKRRWPRWQPWLVTGGSLALVVAGVALEVGAEDQFDEFDIRWADSCQQGCQQSQQSEHIGILNRARWLHRSALAAGAIGTAGVLVGGILLWLNRPRTYFDESAGSAPVDIVPMVTPATAGVSARVTF